MWLNRDCRLKSYSWKSDFCECWFWNMRIKVFIETNAIWAKVKWLSEVRCRSGQEPRLRLRTPRHNRGVESRVARRRAARRTTSALTAHTLGYRSLWQHKGKAWEVRPAPRFAPRLQAQASRAATSTATADAYQNIWEIQFERSGSIRVVPTPAAPWTLSLAKNRCRHPLLNCPCGHPLGYPLGYPLWYPLGYPLRYP